MKLQLLLVLLLIASHWAFAQNFPPIEIEYNYAGLTRIRIVTNHLTLVTHSPNTNVLQLQNLSNYDRSESQANLTESDNQLIHDWITTNNFSMIAREYPSGDPRSYGSSFHTTLTITLSGVQHHATWDGTSDCPEIKKAAQQLVSICAQITQKKKDIEHAPPEERVEAPRP